MNEDVALRSGTSGNAIVSMSQAKLQHYKSRAARALLLLHEQAMRDFLVTWQDAKKAGVTLPSTEAPNFQSMETLLRHVLGCGGYMRWICEKLGLEDPEIQDPPPVEEIEAKASSYLDYVLERFQRPLASVETPLLREQHESRRGGIFHAETTLEHAVIHPIRHAFQLRELLSS